MHSASEEHNKITRLRRHPRGQRLDQSNQEVNKRATVHPIDLQNKQKHDPRVQHSQLTRRKELQTLWENLQREKNP